MMEQISSTYPALSVCIQYLKGSAFDYSYS